MKHLTKEELITEKPQIKLKGFQTSQRKTTPLERQRGTLEPCRRCISV